MIDEQAERAMTLLLALLELPAREQMTWWNGLAAEDQTLFREYVAKMAEVLQEMQRDGQEGHSVGGGEEG